MNHPTELTLMLFAEEAMGADMDQSTRALVEEHLGSCDACRRAVSQLRLENQAITRALDSAHEYLPQTLGRFQKPHRLRSFTLATLSAACTAWLVQWSWKSLFEGLIFGGIGWAVSTWMPSVYSLGIQLFLIFQEKGADMLTDYMAFIVAFIALLTLIGLRGVWRKPGILPGLILTLGTATTLLGLPPAGHALQIIQEEKPVIIEATRTVDDTLIITARDVTVHGNVNGNLLIAGEDIEITGRVLGNLLTFADDVQISGSVDGMTVAAGDSLEFTSATILGDLWLAADSIDVDANTDIGGNLTSASSSLDVAGKVGKDLVAAAERLSVSGQVGQDIRATAKHIDIADAAVVAGDITYRTQDEDELTLGSQSTVEGEVDYMGRPKDIEFGNHFGSHDFYLWGLLWFLAAFIVGWLALTLFPKLQDAQLGPGKEGLKTAGVGFLVLVSVPVMSIIVAITLVGLPLSLIATAAWLVAWYLAKIVLAHLIGRSIFERRHDAPSLVLSLFVGLVIVTAAVNLPLIGGTLNLIATVVGLGLLAQLWLNRSTTPPDQAS